MAQIGPCEIEASGSQSPAIGAMDPPGKVLALKLRAAV
jgi:hypothetical protein